MEEFYKKRDAPIQSPTATMQSMKNLLQQQGQVRVQGLSSNKRRISLGGVNPKSTPPGQQYLAPSPPQSAGIVVGSPPTLISKCSAGNPMTSVAGKVSPPAMVPSQVPSQPAKNSQLSTSRKSSPADSPNVPSIQSNSLKTPPENCNNNRISSRKHNHRSSHSSRHILIHAVLEAVSMKFPVEQKPVADSLAAAENGRLPNPHDLRWLHEKMGEHLWQKTGRKTHTILWVGTSPRRRVLKQAAVRHWKPGTVGYAQLSRKEPKQCWKQEAERLPYSAASREEHQQLPK
ncbi:hypothetical protein ACLOJK_003816 [Asimina triloba]